jgi:HD-GYP domain-containing protein (c-di-GMP phosphodiesterase class II)
MRTTPGSITDFASLMPFADAPDLSERMTRLAHQLREAPLTHEGKALFDMATQALASLPADPVSVERVMCLLFIARHGIYTGNAYAGLDPASQAVAMAGHLGDANLRAKALKILGAIYLESGSYPDTVSAFTAALEAARAIGDRVQEAEVLSNLGLAHQYAGHYGEAVPCYERAVELSESAGVAVGRAAALSNLALACLQLRDYTAGIDAAERAIECLQSPADPHERMVRTMVECYYARLLMEVCNLPKARERIALARQYASGATAVAQLVADMTLGLAEVYDPASRDIGLSRLQKAVNESRRGVPSALRDALAMIVRGYEVAGQPNAALVYLHEVVQLNGDSRVRSVLERHRLHLVRMTSRLDQQADVALEQQRQELRFQRLSMDVLRECMLVLEKNTVAAELHDDETGEHCYRVGALAKELARRKGMDADMCTLIDLSARLHDIGKLRVPDAILLKPGRFTAEERAIMAKHCEQGWELIGEGGLKQLFVAQEIALNHHERWDGSGYPNRRQGNMIPLAARIAALADVFDALTHRRCYKEAWPVEEALGEIARLRGRHFDPELTDLFLQMVPQLQAQYRDLDAYLGAEARKNDFIIDRARVARDLKRDLDNFDLRR